MNKLAKSKKLDCKAGNIYQQNQQFYG